MISYKLLSNSIDYYERQGFTRIETPWTVSKYTDNITKPSDVISFQLKHDNSCLVASGEQSFLFLYLQEQLPKGQFQTTTPCYRADQIDFLHSRSFIKNELIKTDIVNEIELEKIIKICFNFYKKYLPGVKIIKTKIGYDIEYEGMELGSYGIRHSDFISWIYATGCAEPRLSKIINLSKNKYGIPQKTN